MDQPANLHELSIDHAGIGHTGYPAALGPYMVAACADYSVNADHFPCAHRGNRMGSVKGDGICEISQPLKLPVFSCDVFGECVINSLPVGRAHPAKSLRCCAGCANRLDTDNILPSFIAGCGCDGESPVAIANALGPARSSDFGLGDFVARAISVITLGRVKPCAACLDRKSRLNRFQLWPMRWPWSRDAR